MTTSKVATKSQLIAAQAVFLFQNHLPLKSILFAEVLSTV